MTSYQNQTPSSEDVIIEPVRVAPTRVIAKQPFNEEDLDSLLESAESIEDIDPAKDAEAWNAWAENSVRCNDLADGRCR